mgnify:CR=1 FL=1
MSAQIFSIKDRQDATPCMAAFEKWWAQNREGFPRVSVQDAWQIFRNGWWKAEDEQTKEIA